jgi:hypothetical protein
MRKPKFTRESLIRILKEEYAIVGKPLKVTDMSGRAGKNTWIRYFGSWKAAVKAADLPIVELLPITERVCAVCNTPFAKKPRSSHEGRVLYCSTKCSNASRRKPGFIPRSGKNRLQYYEYLRRQSLEEYNSLPFADLSWERKRKRVIEEQAGKCLLCANHTWLDRPIKLQIDHINGINSDDRRENLRALCPNCHSFTDTFGSKNINKKLDVSDDQLLAALRCSPSISKALRTVGMTNKGHNYARCHELMAAHQITLLGVAQSDQSTRPGTEGS